MEIYVAFIMKHWLLFGAFLIVLMIFLWNEWRIRSLGVKEVSSLELVDFLNHAQGLALDLRPNEQYNKGHILGATNIPLSELSNRVNMLNKYKNKPVILVCARGLESPKGGKILKENGFTNLYYLGQGMQGWQSNGMPIVKK